MQLMRRLSGFIAAAWLVLLSFIPHQALAQARSSPFPVPNAVQPQVGYRPLPPQANQPAAAAGPALPSQTGTSDVAYPATLENIVKAGLKLHAFDLSNDQVIDDMSKLFYCQIYTAHHLDEFTWKKVRIALREKLQQDLPTYPTTLFLDRIEEFTTYDFPSGRLQMEPQSIMIDVTRIRLIPLGGRSACRAGLSKVTQDFVMNLSQTLNINGVKLNEGEAQAVVSGLANDTTGNQIRRHGYGRYFLTLVSVLPAPFDLTNVVLFAGKIDRITFLRGRYLPETLLERRFVGSRLSR